ncbi:MAG: MBL fold metallo-hydrolase [Acidimicrobiales bacterium]
MSRTPREEQLPPIDEITELAPNIRRLQLPITMPGLGHVNCYILDDERGATLVDPGLPGPRAWKALMDGLARAELAPKHIHSVVITHSHPDHFGAAGRLRTEHGCEIITHKNFRLWWDIEDEDDQELLNVGGVDDNDALLDDPLIKNRRSGPRGPTPWGGENYHLPWHKQLAYSIMRKGWGGRWFATPTPTKHLAEADRVELAGREFVAVHTPGHTVDHLCLHDPDSGVMFCGDHVLPTITPHISGMTTATDPLDDFFASLDRMKDFSGVKLALPAHGNPFTDLSGRVEDIKIHHLERLDILRDSSDKLGPATVEAFMKQLFKERSWGPMAESETFAHLEHLRHAGEGNARRREDGLLEYTF